MSRQEEYDEDGKKTRRKIEGYQVFTVITFIIIAVYLLGYLFNFVTRPSVRVESVEMGSISVPATVNGLIIREESVVTSSREGSVVYYYTDKQRVAKGKVICAVEDSAKVEKIETEIENIDRSIIDIQKNRTDISLFSDDIKNIESEIESSFDDYAYKFMTGDISGVYVLKERVKNQIDTRTGIWVAENSQSLSSLQEERLNYETQLGENKAYVKNDKSGIISYSTDGFESVFTPETLGEITKENFKMTYDTEYIRRSEDVGEGDVLFKIVSSNTWYIAAFVDEDECATWTVGDEKELFTTVNDEEKSIKVNVMSMTSVDKEVLVVFKTDKDILDFLGERLLSFKINEDKYEGFKIPNEAIVEKSFLKIPVESVIESVGETGVIKRDNGTDTFVNVNVTKYDDEYAYVLQSYEGIKLGDTIVAGTGMEAGTFTISELVVYKGVYVANSSMAQFKTIDIIGQNADYTIVDSESGYGLRIYDKIVADASTVSDSQQLY